MFETQSTDEWLPEWARRLRPILFSLLITPIAIMLGASDWGPEGPQVYIGFLIFPYAALVYFAAAVTQNVGLLYVSLFLLLLQFPAYGIIISAFQNRRQVTKVTFFLHIGTGLFILGCMFYFGFPGSSRKLLDEIGIIFWKSRWNRNLG